MNSTMMVMGLGRRAIGEEGARLSPLSRLVTTHSYSSLSKRKERGGKERPKRDDTFPTLYSFLFLVFSPPFLVNGGDADGLLKPHQYPFENKTSNVNIQKRTMFF